MRKEITLDTWILLLSGVVWSLCATFALFILESSPVHFINFQNLWNSQTLKCAISSENEWIGVVSSPVCLLCFRDYFGQLHKAARFFYAHRFIFSWRVLVLMFIELSFSCSLIFFFFYLAWCASLLALVLTLSIIGLLVGLF